jgi:hypothetical protein
VSAEERTITVAISRDEAYDFLRELAEDDDLRARLEADPGSELANRGIVIPPQLLPAQARLASKAQIEDLLHSMGDDPDDKFGRPKGEAWLFHLLCFAFHFGALPFVQRDPERDGAP